ncbi:MAG TPA: LysM domain-containing protein [Acetobacteraceae bacterium]
MAPGDTLYGIATAHHDSLPDVEADNAQIAKPALLFPGQVVFSPGHSLVNATTTAQIQAAEQADAALADAPAGQPATRVAALQHASQQQWAEAQSDIANDLRAQARDKLLPDKVVQPTVNALNQWAVGSDKLRQATQAAYQQVDDEWQKQGITSQQLAPVLQARQAATQDEAALSRLRAPANRAIVQGEQAQASQAWTTVQQRTQQWLENNAGTHAFPEVAAAQRVKELDALAPGDTKFAAANQAALQSATQTWNSLGITHAKLDPVLNAYHDWQTAVQQRTQAESNPHLHNEDPGAPSLLNQQVNAAHGELQGAIERQLEDAAGQSTSPQGRSQAMLAREAILQMVGRQTTGFRSAVDAADTDLQVTKPAQQVAAAYRSGAPRQGRRLC